MAKNSSCKYLSKAIIFSIFRFLTRVLNFSIKLTSRKRWNILKTLSLMFRVSPRFQPENSQKIPRGLWSNPLQCGLTWFNKEPPSPHNGPRGLCTVPNLPCVSIRCCLARLLSSPIPLYSRRQVLPPRKDKRNHAGYPLG